jgi:hypothetical protein
LFVDAINSGSSQRELNTPWHNRKGASAFGFAMAHSLIICWPPMREVLGLSQPEALHDYDGPHQTRKLQTG